MKTLSVFCPSCAKATAHHQQTCNHVLHLLVSLFMCGAWLPVWFLLAFSPGPPTCGTCGNMNRTTSDKVVRWLVYGSVALLFGTIGLVLLVVNSSSKG